MTEPIVAQIKQTFAAGEHVISEKPLAGSLKDVDEVMQPERASGKRVMPIFQRRFGNGLQKLKFLQQEDLTGRAYLASVETQRRRRPEYSATWHGKWQTEMGGVLVTLAIHIHDILYYTLGPAQTVYAHLATLVNPVETEETAATFLPMADGSLAALTATTGSAAQVTRIRFCVSNLSAESNTEVSRSHSGPWMFTGATAEVSARIEDALSRFIAQREDYEEQFHRFYQALTYGGELPVTLADARASVEMITAVYHSAETRQPVTLPMSTNHPKYASWLPHSL